MLEKIPSQSAMTECLKCGKNYVRPLIKNTKWNACGILAARIGLMSINIAGAVKRFAVCMQGKSALVL